MLEGTVLIFGLWIMQVWGVCWHGPVFKKKVLRG